MLFSTTLKVKYVRGALCLGPTDRQQQSLLFSSTLPTDRSLIVLQHFLTSEEFLLQEICFTREGTKPSYSQRPPPSTLRPPANICPVIRCTLFPLNPLAYTSSRPPMPHKLGTSNLTSRHLDSWQWSKKKTSMCLCDQMKVFNVTLSPREGCLWSSWAFLTMPSRISQKIKPLIRVDLCLLLILLLSF